MGFFRSEDMTLYQITVPKDDIWEIINAIGNLNMAHFVDLNKGEQPFNLPYTGQIKRCEEAERRLLNIMAECKSLRVPIQKPKTIDQFLSALQTIKTQKKKASNLLFEEIESDIKDKEKFVMDQIIKIKEMQDTYLTMIDFLKVLENVQVLIPRLQGGGVGGQRPGSHQHVHHHGSSVFEEEQKNFGINPDLRGSIEELPFDVSDISIAYVAGTIQIEEQDRLKKLLFRATRGKALSYFREFTLPQVRIEGKWVEPKRCVYMVVFQEGRQIRERITRICDSFMGQRFELPPLGQMAMKIAEVKQNIQDSKQLNQRSKHQLKNYLNQINQVGGDHPDSISALEVYKWFVAKEKNLYAQLNLLKSGTTAYIGYFWSPNEDEEHLFEVLRGFPTTDFRKFLNHTIPPPTYIKINEFTAPFQEVVNTYGIPTYKEINPATFACVSFPFLFGVMFGDMGHGFCLFTFGCILVFLNDRFKGTALEDVCFARYFLVMMGFFAMFNGFIYNEAFAIPLPFFQSCYTENYYTYNSSDPYSETGYHRITEDCVYEFGFDVRWQQSSNYLTLANSIKMKIAVILGVLQMSLGIIMKGLNSIYFRRYMDFFVEFIPQIIMLQVLFGWMDTMIIGKWLFPFQLGWTSQTEYDNIARAPSIISVMINMFLAPTVNPEDQDPVEYNNIFGGTSNIQTMLSDGFVTIVLICVPIMLCVKPCVFCCSHKEEHHEEEAHGGMDQPHISGDAEKQLLIDEKQAPNWQEQVEYVIAELGKSNEAHTCGDVTIHQLIETIEFVLGTISNTASYLRLWALSLAHSELANVFLTETLMLVYVVPISGEGWAGFMYWAYYMAFISFTFFVLLMMDVLECFLHCLRLHWVEFQNKFYKGQGYKYTPFSFERVLHSEMRMKR